MSTPTGSTAVGGIGRFWPAVVIGAVVGAPLGLWAGNWGSAPGLAGLAVLFPLATTGLLVAVLLIAAALSRSAAPLVATLAVVAGFCLGYVVAPGASGSIQDVSGTGTAGTRADPSSLWSGPVTCEWPKDESTSVVQVRGYDVPIDPALLPDVEAGFETMRIIQVNVDGSVYIEGGMSDTYGGRTVGMERVVAIERASADGHTGTAVLGTHGGDIVFSWTCAGGP